MLRELSPLEQETQSIPDLRISPYALQPFPRGVDKTLEKRGSSYTYEEKCFRDINEQIPKNGFAIGPHLIDHIFSGRGNQLGGIVRPDTILLRSDNGTVFIERMYEFKIGDESEYRKQISRKVDGLRVFSDKLRQNPDFLPLRLSMAIGDYYNIPPQIEVPTHIPITFYFPDPRASTSPVVDFRMIAAPKPAFSISQTTAA